MASQTKRSSGTRKAACGGLIPISQTLGTQSAPRGCLPPLLVGVGPASVGQEAGPSSILTPGAGSSGQLVFSLAAQINVLQERCALKPRPLTCLDYKEQHPLCRPLKWLALLTNSGCQKQNGARGSSLALSHSPGRRRALLPSQWRASTPQHPPAGPLYTPGIALMARPAPVFPPYPPKPCEPFRASFPEISISELSLVIALG